MGVSIAQGENLLARAACSPAAEKLVVGKDDPGFHTVPLDLPDKLSVVALAMIVGRAPGDHQLDVLVLQPADEIDGDFDPLALDNPGNLEKGDVTFLQPYARGQIGVVRILLSKRLVEIHHVGHDHRIDVELLLENALLMGVDHSVSGVGGTQGEGLFHYLRDFGEW